MTKETGGRFNLFKVVGAVMLFVSVPACIAVRSAGVMDELKMYGFMVAFGTGLILFVIGRLAD